MMSRGPVRFAEKSDPLHDVKYIEHMILLPAYSSITLLKLRFKIYFKGHTSGQTRYGGWYCLN